MSKLIKKYQGSGRLYLYNQSDNTYVHLLPALKTYTAQKQIKQLYQRRELERKQKDQQDKRNKYNEELNIARQTFRRKHQKEQEAFDEIKKGRHYNKMDQTTLNVTNPMTGPTTTYTQTPEEEKVQRPVPGYKDPAGEIVLSLITLPFGGHILKTAAAKLLTSKFGRRLLYDIAANEAFNGIYSGITDRDFASDVNYISGLNENNMFGDLVSFNLASAGRKALGKAMYLGFIRLPQTKRAVEVAMTQSPTANSYYEFKDAINHYNSASFKEGNKAKLRYILTGEVPENEVLVFGSNYTGTGVRGTDLSVPKLPRGLVLAFVYGEKLDPSIATFKGYANEVIPQIHDDYVKRVYPHKRSKILVYEVGPTNKHEAWLTKTSNPNPNKPTVLGYNGEFISKNPNYEFNVQGHLTKYDPITLTAISSDIWKFNPTEYWDKWLNGLNMGSLTIKLPNIGSLELPPIKLNGEKVVKAGLKLVDDVGNPIILETTPVAL